jgi:hypothetical protein
MSQRWYIDAWSVIDGYAFASLRPPDSLDALATFFVCPPYFEPESVASLATALAATRGHFQESYRVGNEEVPFDSPEQVVEAVRRAYRAGGLDISGTPLPRITKPRPSSDGEVLPASLVDGNLRAAWEALQSSFHCGYADDRRMLEGRLSDLIEAMFPALLPKFIGSTLVEMIEALAREENDPSLAARELGAWITRAWSLGMTIDVGSAIVVSARGEKSGFSWPMPELPRELVDWLRPFRYRTSGATVSELRLPFIVPIPYDFQSNAGGDFAPTPAPIPTLGHLMAAISADPWCLSQIDSIVKFVPVIVGTLAQLPTSALPYQGVPVTGSRALGQVCGAAARWLARTLPSVELRGHVVERTIHELVVRLLTRTDATTTRASVAETV